MEKVSKFRPPPKPKEERLPRCYKDVEKVIRTVKSCQSNFKTVLANSRLRGNNFKKVYSLSVNILKHYNYIQEILNRTHLLEKEQFLRREFASILIYEIIFGKGYIPGENKVVSVIRKYEKDIFDVHQMLESNADKFLSTDFSVPRYVRVHTLVTTVAYVIKDLENLGFHQVIYDNDLTEAKYLELVRSLDPGSFLVDFHFKDILVFEHSEKLIHLDIYKNGHIFLQDKASYIPVHALNPESGSAVLDACAAPGMKTVHIASKMKNKGILIACEMDKTRFESLKEMIQYGSVKIAKVLCKDFRSLDPMDQAYSTIEYILLDPSCSGSGMVSRMDEVTDTKDSKNKERLMKLSGFQIILLKHALKFPSVKKVVYSTCSVHEEENENVVHEVLQQFESTFKLVSVMPEWSERGLDHYEFGHLCLRTVPEKHLTNGFFVAMFERIANNNDYGKGIRFSKNRKFKMNSDELLSGAEKAYDDSNSCFDENNEADENILNEKKCNFLQKQSHGFQNDSSLPSNSFEKEVSISNTIENNNACNRNLGKETVIKGIEHDPNVNKKHKKRKKEDPVNNFSHSNQALTNDETSISTDKDNSNRNSEMINDFDHDSNVIKKHKKKKKSRKSSVENCYPEELTNETNVLTTRDTFDENIEKEPATRDIEPESKIKKMHKRKRKSVDSDEIICNDEELTNVLVIDKSSMLANIANSNKKLGKEPGTGFDQDKNGYKKHKKKNRRDDSLEIIVPPSPGLINETMASEIKICTTNTNSSLNLGKETVMENFECVSNTSKKHKKKKKSRKSSVENCHPEELTNETNVLTTQDTFDENIEKEPATTDIEPESKIKKKHKRKRKSVDSEEIICNGEELTNANSSLNLGKETVMENFVCVSHISKKHKKKRKAEDLTEFLCEPKEESTTVNSILNNDSNENCGKEPAKEYFDHDSKVNKKHKNKKKKKDLSEISQPSEQEIPKLVVNETYTLKD